MNYEKVIKDYASGKINRAHWCLTMDNDGGYWDYTGPSISEEDEDSMLEKMRKEYGLPGGYHDIVDVLRAAGVECGWV